MSATKEASITVYLMEELGDARLRCDQLLRALADVTKLVEQSSHRDHIFEVAGHLLKSVPETAFKLQKALQAVSLAADRLDYEELKQDLLPEKVEELERVLKDVRIRPVQHRSQGVPMKPVQVAEALRTIAKSARETGVFPVEALVDTIHKLSSSRAKQASVQVDASEVLDRIATTLETAPCDPVQLGDVLTRLAKDLAFTEDLKLAYSGLEVSPDNLLVSYQSIFENSRLGLRAMSNNNLRLALTTLGLVVDEIGTLLVHLGSTDATLKADALSREVKALRSKNPAKLARFEEGVPADPTVNMDPEDAETWKDYNEEYGDKFKTAAKGDPVWIRARFPGKDVDSKPFKKGEDVLYWPSSKTFMTGAKADAAWKKFEAEIADEAFASRSAFDEGGILSRYEEGVPADPTENMDPEDAEEWKENTEEYGDKFKTASLEFRNSKALMKLMDQTTQDLLDTRVKVRRLNSQLNALNSDASGTVYTNNYQNPELKRVLKGLYDLDLALGVFDTLEGFSVRTFPKLVVKTASSDRVVASEEALEWKAES